MRFVLLCYIVQFKYKAGIHVRIGFLIFFKWLPENFFEVTWGSLENWCNYIVTIKKEKPEMVVPQQTTTAVENATIVKSIHTTAAAVYFPGFSPINLCVGIQYYYIADGGKRQYNFYFSINCRSYWLIIINNKIYYDRGSMYTYYYYCYYECLADGRVLTTLRRYCPQSFFVFPSRVQHYFTMSYVLLLKHKCRTRSNVH